MFPHYKSVHCLKVKMTVFLGLSYIKYKIIIFINVRAKKLISRPHDVFVELHCFIKERNGVPSNFSIHRITIECVCLDLITLKLGKFYNIQSASEQFILFLKI